MTFWQYMTTGYFEAQDKRQRRFIDAHAFIFPSVIFLAGALANWVTNGQWLWVFLSGIVAAALISVISYVLFKRGANSQATATE